MRDGRPEPAKGCKKTPRNRQENPRSGFLKGGEINSGKIRTELAQKLQNIFSGYILVCRNNSLTISLRAPEIGRVPMTSLACARILTCAWNDNSFQHSSTAAPR